MTQQLSGWATAKVNHAEVGKSAASIKWALFAGLILVGFAAETVIPVHIAFIPILIPPLLHVMNKLRSTAVQWPAPSLFADCDVHDFPHRLWGGLSERHHDHQHQ